MASLIRYDPLVDTGIDELFRGFFYGNAHRSITPPTELDETQSEARYDKGVLELKLVKKAASAGKRLNVQ